LIGYALALLVFLQFAHAEYTTTSRFIAWLLFVVGTLPMVRFLFRGNIGVPFLELVLLAYVNAFSLPVFFEAKNTIMIKILYPDNEPVAECLIYALLAILALWFGYRVSPSVFKVAGIPRFSLRCDDNKLFYFGVIVCLISQTTYSFMSAYGGLGAVANVIASADLGMALLALLYYKTELSKKRRAIVILILLSLVLKGIIIGMTQAIMQPLLIWFICRWLITRKFEFRYIWLGVFVFVLLQPVKLGYRSIAWYSGSQLSSMEKIDLFSNLFYNYWINTDSYQILESASAIESTSTRTSLLLQTAHVIDWTPHIVPYKEGKTLYFMLVTWIPRFVWPEKPTAQQANIDYAVDYGITTVEGIERTMFGVGQLGEVFMNFGPFGILPMFLLIGMLTYIPKYVIKLPKEALRRCTAIGADAGIASVALSLSVLLKVIFIGSTVADSYGGMMQLIIVQGGMLYFFTRKIESNKSQSIH